MEPNWAYHFSREYTTFCFQFIVLVLLLALFHPYKFIQSPMDFGPLNFLKPTPTALFHPYKFIQSPMDFVPLNFLKPTPTASLDFGRIVFNSPSAVLRPQHPQDISLLLRSLSKSSVSRVTVAARGAGHSINGQAQTLDGIVVEMDSLPRNIEIHKERDGEGWLSYADVSAGVLWVELLEESLKKGLAPRSWTDYLYLSIGGTLSNGGISGQTFKYGPQISNVLQLEVVTGIGELVICSPTKSSELFYAVLGGLGQFGIITSARILLQDTPQKVEWVRAFYDDFEIFTKDQEMLVSKPDMMDYVEGFVVLNEESLHTSSIAFPSDMSFISKLHQGSSEVYYCIEFAVHEYQAKESKTDEVVEKISRQMNHMLSHLYRVELSYFDFLNRVRMDEMSLRKRGLWDVPHPWLNLFIPKSGISKFKDLLMEHMSPPNEFEGPILIYPILRDKWDSNTSAVLPDDVSGEKLVYTVGMLRLANPSTCPPQCLRDLLRRTQQIADVATTSVGIGGKQYLPHHQGQEQWREHFGSGKWERFVARKTQFDPLDILAPGQGIFQRRYATALLHPSQ